MRLLDSPCNCQSVLKSWQHGTIVLSHSGTQSSFSAQMLICRNYWTAKQKLSLMDVHFRMPFILVSEIGL